MGYSDRLKKFQEILGEHADVAFIPLSSDLQYLTGVPRDVPNYGHNIHPGDWLEGAWITPNHDPIFHDKDRRHGTRIELIQQYHAVT